MKSPILLSLASGILAIGLIPTVEPPHLPQCWQNCTTQQGVNCGWNDWKCLCRAANAGLIAATNACACDHCQASEFADPNSALDLGVVFLNTLSVACIAAFNPLASGVKNAALAAGKCGRDNAPTRITVPIATAQPTGLTDIQVLSYSTLNVPVAPTPVTIVTTDASGRPTTTTASITPGHTGVVVVNGTARVTTTGNAAHRETNVAGPMMALAGALAFGLL